MSTGNYFWLGAAMESEVVRIEVIVSIGCLIGLVIIIPTNVLMRRGCIMANCFRVIIYSRQQTPKKGYRPS